MCHLGLPTLLQSTPAPTVRVHFTTKKIVDLLQNSACYCSLNKIKPPRHGLYLLPSQQPGLSSCHILFSQVSNLTPCVSVSQSSSSPPQPEKFWLKISQCLPHPCHWGLSLNATSSKKTCQNVQSESLPTILFLTTLLCFTSRACYYLVLKKSAFFCCLFPTCPSPESEEMQVQLTYCLVIIPSISYKA